VRKVGSSACRIAARINADGESRTPKTQNERLVYSQVDLPMSNVRVGKIQLSNIARVMRSRNLYWLDFGSGRSLPLIYRLSKSIKRPDWTAPDLDSVLAGHADHDRSAVWRLGVDLRVSLFSNILFR
jgi:hypothetical protein